MDAEFSALMKNGTWSLVPRRPKMNVVGCCWVYKIKRKSDGTLERYEAWLVSKGYHQQQGIDFADTFSPVIKPTTIRLVLSHAISQGWTLRQIDIQNAFLHGKLSEVVYMSQPQGYIHPQYPNHVCRLHKAFYGLKQALRAWYSRLSEKLITLGFKHSNTDTSLFIFRCNAITIFILIYVDDIIITGSSTSVIDSVIQSLSREFAVKDLGKLSYFLGVELLPHKAGLFLTQRQYILNLLNRTKMAEARPISSPMSSSSQLSLLAGVEFSNPTLYRSTVGALQYLSITRPDVSFAVNKVCQFMHRPTDIRWSEVKRILRYLKDTINYGLYL